LDRICSIRFKKNATTTNTKANCRATFQNEVPFGGGGGGGGGGGVGSVNSAFCRVTVLKRGLQSYNEFKHK
jgi:hypothetical protein